LPSRSVSGCWCRGSAAPWRFDTPFPVEVIVRTVIAIELLLLLIAVLLVFGHALWLSGSQAHYGERITRARAALSRALNPVDLSASRDNAETLTDLVAVRALPVQLQSAIFLELAVNLSDRQKEVIADLAGRAGLLQGLERRLKSRWWWRRVYAARSLTMLGAGVSLMERLLGDRHPRVRAQAADWAATHPSPEVISALLKLLEDPAKFCRFAAQNSLLRMGAVVAPWLAAYIGDPAAQRLEPALEVAVGLADSRFLSAARGLCREGSVPVRTLATTLLGQIGGEEAAQALHERLSDPEASVRSAAARGLGKLAEWPAAPALARALRDPAWDVRREAGLALRAMGGPGILLLRRALSDADAFAADMARQVLGIPASALARPVL